MNKLISLYRDAIRDDWDTQTDDTLANMQEAELNLLSRLAAGKEAAKKVAELEKYCDKLALGLPDGMLPKDVELLRESNFAMAQKIAGLEKEGKRKADLFTKKCFECSELEQRFDGISEHCKYLFDRAYEMANEKVDATDKISELEKEVERLKDHHCIDCCCAQSWKALGITEYTGKSIPENIEKLKADKLELVEALNLIYEITNHSGIYDITQQALAKHKEAL